MGEFSSIWNSRDKETVKSGGLTSGPKGRIHFNRRYRSAVGLQIPMSQATVADAPFSFEERLVLYESLSFEFLTVLIPEIHDFILMKTVRGYEHDLDVIEEIFKKNKVEKSILIERFDTEMNHVIGHRNKLKLNFAAVLHRCFGEKAADQWLALAK